MRRHIHVYQLFPRHLFAIRLTPQLQAFQKCIFQNIYIKASRAIFITYMLREYPKLVTKSSVKHISFSQPLFQSKTRCRKGCLASKGKKNSIQNIIAVKRQLISEVQGRGSDKKQPLDNRKLIVRSVEKCSWSHSVHSFGIVEHSKSQRSDKLFIQDIHRRVLDISCVDCEFAP